MSKTGQITFKEPKELGNLINKECLIHYILTKTDGYGQKIRGNPEKGTKGQSFAS